MMPRGDRRMGEDTLEAFIRQYLGSHGAGTVNFAWQGGEPTLAGLDFFRKVIELQDRYRRSDQVIENTLQTNGTLLDDEWCQFLHEHRFLIGLSVDGPGRMHDIYRRDGQGGPTSARVVRAARFLAKHHLDFNTLTVVNRENSRRPLQVYRFLRNVIGSRYLQFIPCVEPKGFEDMPPQGRDMGILPNSLGPGAQPGAGNPFVMEWSVGPEDYGDFLISIFDEWFRKDVGKVFVINFEAVLGAWMGLPPPTCTLARTCGRSLVIEHDGSVYSCDHYVYPEHRLGSIHEIELIDMVRSERQSRFGQEKALALPDACKRCRFLFACNGDCPRNRFVRAPDGSYGMNYLCPGIRKFLEHVSPRMTALARGISRGQNADDIARSYAAMDDRRAGQG